MQIFNVNQSIVTDKKIVSKESQPFETTFLIFNRFWLIFSKCYAAKFVKKMIYESPFRYFFIASLCLMRPDK